MQKLTNKEEEVMKLLWKLEKAFVKELLEAFPGKRKPHYNTFSTIVRNLEEKGFVVRMHIPRANPGIRDGQNSVRAKIMDARGVRTFFVNQKLCPNIDEGFMTLQAKEGSTFQEDERLDSQHVLSAIRYFMFQKYPIKFKK